jgi:hypothetical protein
MKKLLTLSLLSLLFISSLYAKENFSEMSTQELIAIIGYVKTSEVESFITELEKRVPTMSDAEKRQINHYEDRLQSKKK